MGKFYNTNAPGIRLIHIFGKKSPSAEKLENVHPLWQPFLEVFSQLITIRFTKLVCEPGNLKNDIHVRF